MGAGVVVVLVEGVVGWPALPTTAAAAAAGGENSEVKPSTNANRLS